MSSACAYLWASGPACSLTDEEISVAEEVKT